VDYQACQSLTALFFEQAARLGDKPFLWAKCDGHYQAQTWRQVAERVSRLSRGLRRLGVNPGDRVVLVSESRPEWFIADLAVLAAGAVTVPAYTTNTPSDHGHVLSHSGAIGAMVSTRALADKLLPAAIEAPDCQFLVSIEDLEVDQVTTVQLHRWDQVESDGAEQDDDVADVVARARRDEVCCFIYTSGTGGVPKGVMLSHGNLLANCLGAYRLLADYGLEQEVFLSFLPLSHSYEHTAGQFFPMSIGAEIYYAEGAEHLLANLAEVRPTIMTAVPRLYESMHQRIRRGVVKQGGLKQKLFEQAVTLGRKQLDGPGRLSAAEWLVNGLPGPPERRGMAGERPGRAPGAGQGSPALRRPAQGHGLRRRGAQPGDRRLLRRPGGAGAPGLRPDRGGADHLGQPAGPGQDGDRGSAPGGGRGADRPRRRDPGARRAGHEGLLARRGRHRGGNPRRLAAQRRHRRVR
jgi:long-chain acyl-CoA synthetase